MLGRVGRLQCARRAISFFAEHELKFLRSRLAIPSRGASPFALFVKQEFSKMHNSQEIPKVMCLIAERWKQLDQASREAVAKASRLNYERAQEAMRERVSTWTPREMLLYQTICELPRLTRYSQLSDIQRGLLQNIPRPPPKRGLTFFLREHLRSPGNGTKQHPTESRQKLALAVQQWKSLPESERQLYEHQATEAFNRYAVELDRYLQSPIQGD